MRKQVDEKVNEVMQFMYQGRHEIRSVRIDGEPWFVARDVCNVLELGDVSKAVSRLDDDEKGTNSILTPGGRQEMLCVNEPGLYSLILGSRKAEARAFKRWITHEVIPSIRQTGQYSVRQLTRLELIELARESELARLEAEKRNAELEYQLRLQEPKVVFADALNVSQNCILVRELAVILKQNGIDIGATRLFEYLRDNGYLVKRKGTDWNTPTQKSMELGLFELKETPVVHSNGTVTVSKTPKVTGKGQMYFVNKFKRELLAARDEVAVTTE